MITIKAVLIIFFSLGGITGSLFTPKPLASVEIVNITELNLREMKVRKLLSAPSFVPEEELYIHIAGGYFSYFESKTGRTSKPNIVSLPNSKQEFSNTTAKDSGSIKIVLSKLGYESRFVYLPKGKLIFSNGSKDNEIFILNKLDYVQIPGSDTPVYRLSAVNPENNRKASLITTPIGTDVPRLIGNLYIEDNNNLESFDIRIYGRNENEAERHLWKKIEIVSQFTSDQVQEHDSELLSLSFGDGITDVEKQIAGRAFTLALLQYNEMGFKFPELELLKVYFRAPADWKEDVPENTIAFYNDVDQYILMPPFNSKFFQERNILGTMGNKDIYFSILFHEFCHYLNNQVNPRIVRHHDEFIASALQLSTLPERLRNQIVDDFSGLVFKNRNDISLLAYIDTPKQFQVASFLFCNSHQAQMKRIILKSHLVIRDPFLIPYDL
jgi:hypothetical protein